MTRLQYDNDETTTGNKAHEVKKKIYWDPTIQRNVERKCANQNKGASDHPCITKIGMTLWSTRYRSIAYDHQNM